MFILKPKIEYQGKRELTYPRDSRIQKVEITFSFPALPIENLSCGEFDDRIPLRFW